MNQAIEGCTILYSDDEHVHVEGRVLTVGIDDKTKEKIAELEALNLKPAQILIQLRNFATKIPSLLQLNNLEKTKKEIRKNKNGTTNMTLQGIVDFYEKHKAIPDDPDQVYASDCWTKVVNEKGEIIRLFRIFLTTKRLLTFTEYVI